MVELLIVSLFVAFFLAVLVPVVEFINLFLIQPMVINAFFSITLSIAGNLLVGFPVKEFILRVFATAFVSRVFLALAEKATDYRPAVVNSARD